MEPFISQGMAAIATAKSSLLVKSLRRVIGKENKNSAERSTRSPAIALPPIRATATWHSIRL